MRPAVSSYPSWLAERIARVHQWAHGGTRLTKKSPVFVLHALRLANDENASGLVENDGHVAFRAHTDVDVALSILRLAGNRLSWYSLTLVLIKG